MFDHNKVLFTIHCKYYHEAPIAIKGIKYEYLRKTQNIYMFL